MLETPFRDRVVIPAAKRHGWKCYFTWNSRHSPSGYPDLTMVRERVIWAELKSDKGTVSPDQHEWLTALTNAGCECYVWKPGDEAEIERILSRRTA